MIEHIVCFKPKPGTTKEQEDRLIELIEAMRPIPGIISLSVGRNITPERGQGYTIGLVVRLRDRAALDVYGPHPLHAPVKEYVNEIIESLIVVDYEVNA